MNKNVLYYSVNFIRPEFYSLLYYSLETLTKYYKNNYDIVVYWCSPQGSMIQDIQSYLHLGQFNLPKDFPHVKFFRTTYDKEYDVKQTNKDEIKIHDAYMMKWYHFKSLFDKGYQKIFMIDADVIYCDDISDMFSALNTEKEVWGQYGYDEVLDKLNYKIPHMFSGQVIIDKNLMESWDSFYDDCIDIRLEMSNKANMLYNKGKITQFKRDEFYYFNEQFCPLPILVKNGAIFKDISFDVLAWHYNSDIHVRKYNSNLSDQKFTLKVNGEDSECIDVTPKIIHLLTHFSSLYIPKKLRLPHVEILRNELIDIYKNEFDLSSINQSFTKKRAQFPPPKTIRRPKRKPLM